MSRVATGNDDNKSRVAKGDDNNKPRVAKGNDNNKPRVAKGNDNNKPRVAKDDHDEKTSQLQLHLKRLVPIPTLAHNNTCTVTLVPRTCLSGSCDKALSVHSKPLVAFLWQQNTGSCHPWHHRSTGGIQRGNRALPVGPWHSLQQQPLTHASLALATGAKLGWVAFNSAARGGRCSPLALWPPTKKSSMDGPLKILPRLTPGPRR